MSTEKILQIVATDCNSEVEEKFNNWYNDIHIPMLFKFKDMVKVTRYKMQGDNPDQAKYLALYEYKDQKALQDFEKSKEFADAMADIEETWKDQMFDIKWVAAYEPIQKWEK